MLLFLLLFTLYPVVTAAQPRTYTLETYAGSGNNGDGRSATSAILVQPEGLAVSPAGKVFISDAGDHRIRRVDGTGAIHTAAGTGVSGMRGDGGPAARAQLNAPYGLEFDRAGALYVADLGNGCIRRIDLEGNIETVAGGGKVTPVRGTPLRATAARLNQPRDVAVDAAGNLYLADFGAHVVYQVTRDGMLSIVAGTGESGTLNNAAMPALDARLSYPAAIAVDASGTIYIADSGNRRIRRLWQGVLSTLTDRQGRELQFGTPTGIEIDSSGRMYIADGSAQMTVLLPTGDVVTIPLGGTSIAVGSNHQIYSTSERLVLAANGPTPVVFAGSASAAGPGDGYNRNLWRFTAPGAIARDAEGALQIADTGNGRIRRLTTSGELTTVTDALEAPISLAFDPQGRLYAGDRATGGVYRIDPGGRPRLFASSEGRLITPAALTFDRSGNLFIADAANGLIRRVNSDGVMTIAAGGGSQLSDGPALTVALNSPSGLAMASDGVLWFTEAGSGRLRRLAGGAVTTVAGLQLRQPRGLRVDADGTLLVADAGENRVVRVTAAGVWTPLAGSGDRGFSGDGEPALTGMLSSPADVLPEPDGSILVADSGNHRIRRLAIAASQGEIPPPRIEEPSVTVLHAANSKPQALAPGQLAYVSAAPMPSEPAVRFGELPATVLSRGEGRVTVQVPAGLAPGAVDVTVLAGTVLVGKGTAEIVNAAPAILSGPGGHALASNEDGQVNTALTPAVRGSIVALYITGEGASPGPVSAEIGGYPAEVIWSGAAPGLAGLMQVNVQTPAGFAPSGIVPVQLTFGNIRTPAGVFLATR